MENSNEMDSQMNNSSFLDMMDVGSSDINWDRTPNCSPIGEQVRMPTKTKPTKGASTKGKNWSSAEDLVLIQAWANTSLDAVTGTDQNLSTYWALTSRFCACVQQILNRNGSGLTLSDKERDAHRLFIELDEKKKPFTLMHCYIEFEKYPKWQTRPPPQKKHKKTSDASPGTTSNDEDFDVCTDALEEEIRPPGTKNDKKERLLKGKASASFDSACKLSLESVWAQKIEKDDAKEATKNARYARAFELQEKQIALQEREDARKQFELEEKIMLMDTSGMSDAQKQFYKKKQDEIAARCQNTSG